ncbi:MAG: holo-ACP synthase [Candidatus Aegiribacteria sp.]
MYTGSSYGVDIESIARVGRALERSGESFLKRIFTDAERGHGNDASFLATRFAAKEAFFKALGTGLSGGVRWHDFELPFKERYPLGPVVSGRSKELLAGRRVLVSVSHTSRVAVAVVFLEGSGGLP